MDDAGATLTKIDDRIVQSDLVFRSGAVFKETFSFIRQDGVRMYIDVDEQDIPIAMEIVHPDDQPIQYLEIEESDKTTIGEIMQRLFADCCGLVNLARAIESVTRDARTPSLQEPLLERRSMLLDRSKADIATAERFASACA